MDTVPVHLRLPRSLHARALALQAEEQKRTARRIKLAPILVDLVEAGLDARSPTFIARVSEPSPLPPCPKCGKELHYHCYGETGSAYCERHQTRLVGSKEPGCDFRTAIRRVGDGFEFCPQERDAMSVPLMGGEPVQNPAFVEEFGPVPEEFVGRTDAYGVTNIRPDGSPVSQTLTCRAWGPSASRDWNDGWGPWVTLTPKEQE
jgi:hypothetical protein